MTAADRDSELWEAYRRALNAMLKDRTPTTEAAALATYSEWCRAFATPGAADALITEFCGRYLPARRRAA